MKEDNLDPLQMFVSPLCSAPSIPLLTTTFTTAVYYSMYNNYTLLEPNISIHIRSKRHFFCRWFSQLPLSVGRFLWSWVPPVWVLKLLVLYSPMRFASLKEVKRWLQILQQTQLKIPESKGTVTYLYPLFMYNHLYIIYYSYFFARSFDDLKKNIQRNTGTVFFFLPFDEIQLS